ncbi:MAG: SpoIID/LytB domain protein [Acidimicrobiales bacterium]
MSYSVRPMNAIQHGRTRLSRTVLGLLLATLLVPLLPTAPAAAADDRIYAEVAGHGWGHGRGMGQFGAQGYALDEGWERAAILDHFYGGTTAGQASAATGPVDPDVVRVEIRANRGDSLRADVQTGVLLIRDVDGNPLWRVEGVAVRLSINGAKTRLESAPTCVGPWTELFSRGPETVELVAESSATLLRSCHDDGSSTWYDGSLRFHTNGGAARTVNVTTIESYLRGVLPAEVPTSWEPAALQSQAVAARSYALAGDTRQLPYADTCDTTLCQVYRGRYRQAATVGFVSSTSAATDAAVKATAGEVRVKDGAIARTEFSSSTGGYTAGGAFPSVVDDGDDVVSNPNHNWNTTVDLTDWAAAQGKGELLGVTASGNGLGVDGGRVLEVTFSFSGGTVVLTGNQVRQALSLKSDWFTVGELSNSGSSVNDGYVVAAYQLFLRREPTIVERVGTTKDLDAGLSKQVFTLQLAASDEWAGVMIDDLYQTVLGRSADDDGRSFWLGRMAAGMRFESVAAQFYGAPEYFASSGGTADTFVEGLYIDILGRPSDDDGRSFWADRIEDGRLSRWGVAAGFYASPESRRDRVSRLYEQILGRSPDSDGLNYWANRLLTVDDVALAASLAASQEFFDNAS